MTSTGAYGLFVRVGKFIAEREMLSAYEERMEMFFTANNTVETTVTLSNLLAPTKPKDTPFVDIVRVLEKHYNPKPLEISQSFHFGSRNQKSGKSVGYDVLALEIGCSL